MVYYCLFLFLLSLVQGFSTDTVCSFHVGGKLFSLIFLEKQTPYEIQINYDTMILFNFCDTFVPKGCSSS